LGRHTWGGLFSSAAPAAQDPAAARHRHGRGRMGTGSLVHGHNGGHPAFSMKLPPSLFHPSSLVFHLAGCPLRRCRRWRPSSTPRSCEAPKPLWRRELCGFRHEGCEAGHNSKSLAAHSDVLQHLPLDR
jgi:hypothetical protein